MEWLFAVAVLSAIYPYVIYPLLLVLASRLFARPLMTGQAAPSVAVLVSAFNEESRILDKIANFNAIDYPADRLQLWIGTDGSTDRTAEVVRQATGDRVHLVERKERSGKTIVLNDLVTRIHADICIFTDVNAFFREDAVRQLVAVLTDQSVGLVSGRTVIQGKDGNAEVEGAYYRFESWVKAREGACGWLPGADGAIYALRSKLYRELPGELINDLAHPCQVVAAGFQARLAPLAVSEESAGEDAGREFNRQTRITAQAAYLLATQTGALLRNGRWGMLWVVFSHKWMRWFTALFMVIGAVALAVISWKLAVAILAGSMLLYIAWRSGASWTNLPVYFLLIHIAYLRGLWGAIAGERYVTWKPRAS